MTALRYWRCRCSSVGGSSVGQIGAAASHVASAMVRLPRVMAVRGLTACYADAADEGGRVPAGGDVGFGDDGAGVRCVDEVVVAEPEADVAHPEEHEVTG